MAIVNLYGTEKGIGEACAAMNAVAYNPNTFQVMGGHVRSNSNADAGITKQRLKDAGYKVVADVKRSNEVAVLDL